MQGSNPSTVDKQICLARPKIHIPWTSGRGIDESCFSSFDILGGVREFVWPTTLSERHMSDTT